MNRSLVATLAVLSLLLALAAPAAAHNMVVDPPGDTEPIHVWVGGHPVPGQGDGLFWHPEGLQPAGHREGLPHACNATNSNPSVVTFIAPPTLPFDTDPCQHGVQP